MQEQREKHSKPLEKRNLLGPVATVFASGDTGSWRIFRPVVDYGACAKCGTCVMYCPADVMTLDKEREDCIQIDFRYCKGCGICANECPVKSIEMRPEGGKDHEV